MRIGELQMMQQVVVWHLFVFVWQSLESSTVLNWLQVRSQNCRINRPNSVVNSSSKCKVLSECIQSLVRACHSAVWYRSFMRHLLWGSSRRPSNKVLHTINDQTINLKNWRYKMLPQAPPEERPQSPMLPVSSFLMNLLQTYEWYHAWKLKLIYNYSIWLVWVLLLSD